MSDRIRMTGLKVFGYHGVTREEREQGQFFLIDVEAEADLEEAASSDRLDQTVDYAPLVKEIQRIVSQERFELMETLAERIAQAVLEHPRVESATVRVAKPAPPIDAEIDSVGVEITRRQPGPGERSPKDRRA